MKKLVKILKSVLDTVLFCLGFKGTKTANNSVSEGLCDYSGQGRNEYGK